MIAIGTQPIWQIGSNLTAKRIDTAEKAFEDLDVLEAVVTVWEDGGVDGTPLKMVREDGNVHQYQGEERLWA